MSININSFVLPLLMKMKSEKIFQIVHENWGHLKLTNACNYISSLFYIYNLWDRLQKYIQSCHTCQIYDSTPTQKVPLQPTAPASLFHTICIDCIHMNTPNLPLKYIIIGRCEFSGWAEAIHVSNISGAIVAKFLYDHFITRFGLFHTLKSDGGPEFRNSKLQSLLENYNINQIIGTPNYPQSHGYIERNHQCLINTLKKMPATQPWYHYLTHALWVDRTQIRSTTGLSAQYLVHGFHGHATLSQDRKSVV